MSENGPVYELRRYRLQPGMREALISLFEREFVETQEEAGMTLHGFYRDRDDANAFVWMRSFPDLESRLAALAAFYGGPVWRKWGAEANATMLNSDNVLLLKASGSNLPFSAEHGADGIVTVSTASLAPGTEMAFAAEWEKRVLPVLEKCGARVDAVFVSDRRPNPFPRLPVREGETAAVWVASFRDEDSLAVFEEKLSRSAEWAGAVFPWLDRHLWRPLEAAKLTPTARSRHGW